MDIGMNVMPKRVYYISLLLALLVAGCSTGKKDNSIEILDGSYLVKSSKGTKLKVTPYGDSMIRLQSALAGESFYPDDHYEMVERHDWSKNSTLEEGKDSYTIKSEQVRLVINKETLATSFFLTSQEQAVLTETQAVNWDGSRIKVAFEVDQFERFTGLGHGYYARAKSIDLKGQIIQRNYGSEPIEQAPLLVPFYMSSKGYGVFLNSTFANTFNFGSDNEYSFTIDDSGFSGRMDYFFIAGPKLTKVLDNYTQLTGRPRLPQKAMFGLQLSDKGHDHNSATPSDAKWWKEKIVQHRNAGYPLDHVINDNRWRAGGGKRCASRIEWDKDRYPDPAGYQRWLKQNGLVTTLDFNRCIAQFSADWSKTFNLPETGKVEFPNSAPDLTNDEFRKWFWQVFEEHALKPELGYPGDALWIDEFDEQGRAPKLMQLTNGLSLAEMRNYWFFLIAKALVQQGWDKSGINKRPFVWVRGMTAGAQRYATLWSGDIYPNYKEMEGQIRGMQLAGLSGFPFWGHDAGGFYDWNANVGPNEAMYKRWAMAFGSFAPIWKPHGMGQSRWPLDRNLSSQQTALKFSQLRYRLMPYLYSAAKQASTTGKPIASPMILDYQDEPLAWQYDLQYMWGDNILVAPHTSDKGNKEVWLPKGLWFDFETNKALKGDRVINVNAEEKELPLYVKAGAIIPQRPYAQSTAFIDKSQLILNVYAGANSSYQLLEDDDVTEAYRLDNASQMTLLNFNDEDRELTISAVTGSYNGAPETRNIIINLFGLASQPTVLVNGKEVKSIYSNDSVTVHLADTSVSESISVRFKH